MAKKIRKKKPEKRAKRSIKKKGSPVKLVAVIATAAVILASVFLLFPEILSPGSTQLANPAAVYCEEQNGTIRIKETESGQSGYCVLPDSRICEEWDYFSSNSANCTTTFFEVSAGEAYNLTKKLSGLLIIDVRSEPDFNGDHISGSVNIPLEELDSRISGLDKERPVLVYCSSLSSARSAAEKFVDSGFNPVYALSGNVATWMEGGFTVFLGQMITGTT